MYNVTRYESELIRAFRENLECLNGIFAQNSISEAAHRKAVDTLLNEFIEDMKNAE